eukprot:g8286.t1
MSATVAEVDAPPVQADGAPVARNGFRQVIDALVCLALAVILVRGFLAEGYMISTGSMAPTLPGFHKRVTCPTCRFEFAVGVAPSKDSMALEPGLSGFSRRRASAYQSTEIEDQTSPQADESLQESVVCPNCGQHSIDISGIARNQGDQLLVHKNAYSFLSPHRWEVVVFRNPSRPAQAYVKRIVGMPGETVAIRHGDVFIDGEIQRKDIARQRAMRILVYDHDFEPQNDADWAPRWLPEQANSDWKRDGAAFVRQNHENLGSAKQEISWVKYRHWIRSGGSHRTVLPIPPEIRQLGFDNPSLFPLQFDSARGTISHTGTLSTRARDRIAKVIDDPLYVKLIHEMYNKSHVAPVNDDYGYNRTHRSVQPVPVRDLMFSARVSIQSGHGRFALEMTDGRQRFRFTLDAATRDISLEVEGSTVPVRTARLLGGVIDAPMQLEMSLFDRQVIVSINGQQLFSPLLLGGITSEARYSEQPIRFGSTDLSLRVDSLKVYRDVHYTRKGSEKPFPLAADDNSKPNKDVAAKEKTKPGTGDSAKSPHRKMNGWRETIESVVVAFILAFLFRSFEAEAFVIPTGSMAPTLRGRHKEVTCEKCKFRFAVGASDEVEQPGYLKPDQRIEDAVCPNCRYVTPGDIVRDLPVFKGDRILVNKFPYEFGDPARWDVLVFKYPEEPDTNYIKRLVGLPGDKLHIRQGDVYIEKENREIEILRKDDPNKQRVLQILVHDNDYPAQALIDSGWPRRWASVERSRKEGHVAGWAESKEGWQEDIEKRAFQLAQSDSEKTRWLRYRHYVPSQRDWEDILKNDPPKSPKPQLIVDFCGYNAYTGGQMGPMIDYGQYWVGDLTINCEVDISEVGADPELLLELNEGARKYRCQINVESGTATLMHNVTANADLNKEEWNRLATGETRLKGPGRYRVTFANVDHRLCLWINDRLIDFGRNDNDQLNSVYAPEGTRGYQAPTNGDLTPVGIAAKSMSVNVSHLRLERDIYYRGEHTDNDDPQNIPVHEYRGRSNSDVHEHLNSLVDDPSAWWKEYSDNKFSTVFKRLGEDEYFVMGDNSPRSKDSRLWPNTYRHAENRHAAEDTPSSPDQDDDSTDERYDQAA